MPRRFQEPDVYRCQVTSYHLLPFWFMALDAAREVLVNEVGEYVVAPTGTARAVVERRLDIGSELYRRLRACHFIFDDRSSPLLDVLATKYRTKRSFLNGFTKLHMFVVTLRCEHSCQYCQVSRQSVDGVKYDMSRETAKRAVDLMFRSPAPHLTLEFQGGEPLLNFDAIRFIVARAKDRAAKLGRGLDIVVATNLALATDEIFHYFRDEGIDVSTSLDGPAFVHDANRPRPGGNSHELTVRNIQRARDILGTEHVAALMTTSRLSLDYPIEIVDEYVRLKFKSIFLRSIRPYGFAVRSSAKTGYETDRYIDFYKRGLAHIIDLNRQGVELAEVFAKILLTKMLTPFPTHFVDLQSPSGDGIGCVIYNHDGDVYTSDEARMLAEMGDKRFRLGNVHRDDHGTVFGGERLVSCVQGSVVESLPGCADCAFQSYCGAEPVFNYTTQGDPIGHRPTSAFCHKNMSIIRHLLLLLATDDPELYRIFFAWIRQRSLSEVTAQVAGE